MTQTLNSVANVIAIVVFSELLLPRTAGAEAAGGVDAADRDTIAFTIRDEDPRIGCDAIHLRVPAGWRASGRVAWSMTTVSPAKMLVSASNPNAPEMWASYPVQTFVWRDNFNLFGLSFAINLGDADPVMGEEIEKPIGSAAECVSQVIVPRFRKDLAQASVV